MTARAYAFMRETFTDGRTAGFSVRVVSPETAASGVWRDLESREVAFVHTVGSASAVLRLYEEARL